MFWELTRLGCTYISRRERHASANALGPVKGQRRTSHSQRLTIRTPGSSVALRFVNLAWPTLILSFAPAGPRDPLRLHPHLHALRSDDQHLGRLPVV
jgi:hypothetical protein